MPEGKQWWPDGSPGGQSRPIRHSQRPGKAAAIAVAIVTIWLLYTLIHALAHPNHGDNELWAVLSFFGAGFGGWGALAAMAGRGMSHL
jgi:hypothetical protein